MKLIPLNNNVLLKLVESNKNIDFHESGEENSSLHECEIVAMPTDDDQILREGNLVFVNDSDLTKKTIDGTVYYICNLDDINILISK